jgi:multiple sugar transport system substrate-binding protein
LDGLKNMRELTFSHISKLTGQRGEDALKQILQEFEQQSGVRVHLLSFDWRDAWPELMRIGIYRHGPDVSEIGSTWLGDLVGMNVLRPFSPMDVLRMGGTRPFWKASWESGKLTGDERCWAMPYWADPRLLFYRRDLVEKARVDEKEAFVSSTALKQTLQSMQQVGIPVPWVVPTHKSYMTLQNAAAWVWEAGGQFLDEDGRRCLFNRPEAIEGFQQYFELGRFLPIHLRELDDTQSDSAFFHGNAAVTISGPWLLKLAKDVPELAGKVGVAPLPGFTFMGGSSLVIWQHTSMQEEALALVQFLTSRLFQQRLGRDFGLPPVRLDAWPVDGQSDLALCPGIQQAMEKGRTFRLTRLWGLVENRLSETMASLWRNILWRPYVDLNRLLREELSDVAKRLEIVLGER